MAHRSALGITSRRVPPRRGAGTTAPHQQRGQPPHPGGIGVEARDVQAGREVQAGKEPLSLTTRPSSGGEFQRLLAMTAP